MLDPEGNLVTSTKGIENLAVNHYKKVLENRPIFSRHSNLKTEKEKLCEERVKLSKLNKAKPWNMKNIEAVLKYLKRNKSRDPHGQANEVFKPEVAEEDLKLALLKIMNRVKKE